MSDESIPEHEPEQGQVPAPGTEQVDPATAWRAGFCAIVGLPNVGKSTLLNRILGQHLSAVSAKPQTTRDRILGIHAITLPDELPSRAQIAYVDTPGVQDGKGPLRRYMQNGALAAANDADVVCVIIDGTDRRGRMPDRLDYEDAAGLRDASRKHPMVIGLNKVDRVGKPELLPVIEAWAKALPGTDIVPISAQTGDSVDVLERVIAKLLPVGPQLFPDDMVTDRSAQFIAQELIREQLYHQLGKELPYACAVQIEAWSERPNGDLAISAVIVVERDSQKAIVVGRGGNRIRELGIAARQVVSQALKTTVHLNLFVKVLESWSSGEAALKRFGYTGGDA